jgi:hypothetical protein
VKNYGSGNFAGDGTVSVPIAFLKGKIQRDIPQSYALLKMHYSISYASTVSAVLFSNDRLYPLSKLVKPDKVSRDLPVINFYGIQSRALSTLRLLTMRRHT